MTRRLCQTGLVLVTLIMSATTAEGNTTAVERRDATHQRAVLVAYVDKFGPVALDWFSVVPFNHVVLAEGIGQVDQETFEIRQEGVYLVSLRVHASNSDRADFHLQVNSAYLSVAAYCEHWAVGAVDAALKLDRDDKLRVISKHDDVKLSHRSMITVVFLAPLEEPGTLIENCKTQPGLCPNGESADVRLIGQYVFRCCMGFDVLVDRDAQCTCRKRPEERYAHFFTGQQREEKKAGPGILNFNVVLGEFGSFKRKSTSQFTAPLTGIYWIAIRIDPISERYSNDPSSAQALVETESKVLLAVHGIVPMSAAAAILLNQGTQFTVKNTEKTPTGRRTVFSVVFLTFNRRPYTGPADYLAFTGYLGVDVNKQLSFHAAQLHYGDMSQGGNARFTIKQTGVYLVSLQLAQETRTGLTLVLKVNGNQVWHAFLPDLYYFTGQTTALILTASDTVEIQRKENAPVGKSTLFSMAFVQ